MLASHSFASITAHEMKFSMKDFFRKCDQIRRKLRIWSYLLRKSLTEIFFFFLQLILYEIRYSSQYTAAV